MQVQVLYLTENSKAIQSKGFSSPDEAEAWMNEKSTSNFPIQNARIVVDYAAVKVYQEMYETLKEQLFGNNSKLIKEKKTI